MSIGSILSMARTAMSAHQTAIQVASQNISNATVEGYSRQRVELSASLPLRTTLGSIGTGVQIDNITRARDALLDATYRSDVATASYASTTRDLMTEIQSIFREPSDTALASTIDAFWSSWSELSTNPTSDAARSVVMQRGRQLANTLNDVATHLDALDQRAREHIADDVLQINKLTKQIADMNPRVVSAESDGASANDLRDARDRALDQLAKLVGARAVERGDGSVGVYIGGRLVVDGSVANEIATTGGRTPTVVFAGTNDQIEEIGGSLGAWQVAVTHEIPAVISQLDALAKGLVETVNTIHSTGTVFSGNPPVGSPAGNFFEVTTPPPAAGDPYSTARSIRLAATLTDTTKVAAAGTGAVGPGNNSVASALAGLRDARVTFTSRDGSNVIATSSFGEFFRQTISNIATATRSAEDAASIHETLAANSDNRRQSVSGVSTDEELIDVIRHQHAYSAAARLVSVVDEMAQTLINLGR